MKVQNFSHVIGSLAFGRSMEMKKDLANTIDQFSNKDEASLVLVWGTT